MIIVSQDKNTLVNFNNVDNIDIVADLTRAVSYSICYETSTKREELGEYETEERAREVLQEIIKKYETSMCSLGKNIISIKNIYVYEMPEM